MCSSAPADPRLILYNYEWTSVDCGFRRMHLFDGTRHYALRQPDALCRGGDWTCHEMWSRDGAMIYYHGGYEGGGYYIGRVDPASVLAGTRPDYTEIRLPADYRSYGHFTEGEGGLLVTDGYYRENGGGNGSAYISVVQPDWEAGKTVWTPLCRHGSGWGSQDAHPHPIFNHRGDAVYFTSDADGTLKAYRVPCRIGG